MSISLSEKYPRGRDTSVALTAVRTVLSHAENAWVELGRATDPDAAEMREALGDVIERLDRWRRASRRRHVNLD